MDNFTTKKGYEYQIVDGHVTDLLKWLNKYGKQGYQVVSHVANTPVEDDPNWHIIIMAREIVVGPDGQELSS